MSERDLLHLLVGFCIGALVSTLACVYAFWRARTKVMKDVYGQNDRTAKRS